MPDYNNGKVYVIRNQVNDMVYVGSTVQTLAERMAGHRGDYKRKNCKSYKLYQAFDEIGITNFYIELVEDYPCESKEQLFRQEGHFIREYDSYKNGYNCLIAGRTPKEYEIDNKEQIFETHKKWRETNKIVISEKNKIKEILNKEKRTQQKIIYYIENKNKILKKYTCEVCNCELVESQKHRHERSPKHQQNLIEIDRNR
jgi:hypothetical protein